MPAPSTLGRRPLKIVDTSNPRLAAEQIADDIAALDYVVETVRLPDLHLKEGMEAPSSFVVATENSIIPHLVSESINDGMGLIATGVSADDVSPSQLEAILTYVNKVGATNKMAPTPYSWTPELLEAACRSGAEPLLHHYGFDPRFLDTIEERGRATAQPLSYEDFAAAVPRFLRTTKLTRSEIGLNFGGNHFLEIQVVDRIVDQTEADRMGVRSGELVVMYHLGPGPLGSILSNLYAYRAKPQLHRKVGYALFRNLLHITKGLHFHRTFARLNDWLAVEADSDQGRALSNVLRVIKNYGFAYRMGTISGIADALHDVLGIDRNDLNLIVDMSHNMIQPESFGDEELWVSRHNCCRPIAGMAGIVAGTHQVASCLTVGPPGCDDKVGGYDHGVGFLVERAQEHGSLDPDPRGLEVRRLRMTRGTEQVHQREVMPLLASDVIEGAVASLEELGFTRPVAYLRPLATLKHKT
jgi:tRNA-splicing ligase RtcB